jgi:hypothetical protein
LDRQFRPLSTTSPGSARRCTWIPTPGRDRKLGSPCQHDDNQDTKIDRRIELQVIDCCVPVCRVPNLVDEPGDQAHQLHRYPWPDIAGRLPLERYLGAKWRKEEIAHRHDDEGGEPRCNQERLVDRYVPQDELGNMGFWLFFCPRLRHRFPKCPGESTAINFRPENSRTADD